MKHPIRVTATNEANFEGQLLQAQRKPAQKYTYLLFQTEAGLRFCLSKHAAVLDTLEIGTSYHVTGLEYTTGHKTFLSIATIIPIRPTLSRIKKRTRLFATAATLFAVVATSVGGLVLHGDPEQSKHAVQPAVSADSQTNQRFDKTPKSPTTINEVPASAAPGIITTDATTPSAGASTKRASPPQPAEATPQPSQTAQQPSSQTPEPQSAAVTQPVTTAGPVSQPPVREDPGQIGAPKSSPPPEE